MKQPASRSAAPASKARVFNALLMCSLLLAQPVSLYSATLYWDGTSTDWSSVASWSTASGAAIPNPAAIPGPDDLAMFSISTITATPQTASLNADQSVGGLFFAGTNTSTTTLLGGGTNRTLDLGLDGIQVNLGAGAVTIGSATSGQNVTLSLQGSQAFVNDSNNALTINNGVTLDVTGTQALTLSGNGSSTNIIAGVISNGAGTMALTKTGAGTWKLNAANTFTGVTTVNAGTLSYGITNALSSGGVTVDGPTAVFDISTFNDSVGTVILNDSGRIIGTTGVLTSSAAYDFRSGSVSAILAGTSGLNKTTTGTVTLSGVNTYTGPTTITAGTLAYGVTNAISSGAVTIDGSSAVLNIGSFNDSVGTVTLSNGGSILGTTGVLTSTATYAMGSGTANVILAGGVGLNKTTAGTVILGGANTYTGNTSLAGGVLTLAAPETAGVSGPLGKPTTPANSLGMVGGTLQYSSANQFDYSGRFNHASSTQAYNVDTNNQNVTWATALTSANGTLSKSGAGTLTLSAASTYSGLTTISGGVLAYGVNDAFGTGGVTVNGPASALNIGTFSDSVGTVILDGGAIVGAGGVLTSTETYDLRSGTVRANLAGASGMNKTTAGSLVLGGSSTYTGTSTLAAGTVLLAAAESVGNSGPLGKSVAANPNSIVLSGATLQHSATNTNDYSGRFSTAVGQQYNINTGGANVTWATALTSSNGTLTKSGLGTLTLSGSNTYTGATTINGGVLTLNFATNNNSKLSDTAALVLGGGVLDTVGGTHSEFVLSTALTAGTSSSIRRTSGTGLVQLNTITRNAGAFLKLEAASIATTDNTNTNGILGGWATVTALGVTNWAVNSTNGADGAITALATYTDVQRLGGVIPNSAVANVRIINGGSVGNVTLAGSPENNINSLNMFANGGATLIGFASPTDVLRVGGDSGGGILLGPAASALSIGQVDIEGILTTGGTANAAPATLSIINEHASNALTVLSVIDDNGTDVVSLAKGGVGLLVLGGSNTYTGVTAVSAGIINLASAEVVGTSGPLGKSAAANPGSIILGGGTLRYSVANQNDYSGRFSTAANQAYNVDTNGQNVTWATALTSPGGAVTKSGAGALSLRGANTFTGGVVLNAGTLNINNATALGATSGAFVINGGSIDNTSGLAITNAGDNALVINGNFSFIGGRGTTHDLNLGFGGATLGTAAGTSRTITTNEGTLTLAGVISNGTTATSIVKAGAGALTLSGTNTFTGGVTLSAGTLNINGPAALGFGGPFTIAGGTLDNTTGSAITINTYPITIGGNFGFNGGAGTTHDLNLGVGTVALGTAVRTITTDAGLLTFGGTIGGTSADALIKAGGGALALSGASNTFTGTTAVNAGTLRLDYLTNNNTKLADGAALILGGGTVELFGGSHTESVGLTTLTTGTISTITRTSGTSVLELNSITPAPGAFLKFTAGSIATTDTINNAGGILGGWATITVGGVTNWARNSTNAANGPVTALGTYTDVGRQPGGTPPAVINDGSTTNVRIINEVGGTSGNITLGAATTTINSLNMSADAGAATISMPSRILSIGVTGVNGGGGILQGPSSGALIIGASAGEGVLTTGGAADATPAALNFITESATNAVTVNSVIANNGTDVVSVAKAGAGVLVFSGTNTYTGTTTVSQGTLRAGGAAGGQAFGNLSAVTLASIPSTALDLNNFGQTIGSLAGGGGTGGNVTLGTATLTTGGDNTSTSFAGVIAGTGGVTKTGTGTWTLSGGNSYTGTTTINGGVIQVASAANVQVLSDRTAVVLGTSAGVALDINGRSETVGSLAGGGASGGNVTLGANGVLTVGGLGTSTAFAGVISGTGTSQVTKTGAGTLTLTGANTFNTLSIEAGGVTLNNAGNNAMADTATIRLPRSGATLTLAGASETIGTLSSVAGSTIALGGNLTVTPSPLTGASQTSTTNSSSRYLTVVSTAGLVEGTFVSGTGITAGTRVAQILSGTTLLLDQVANSSGTNTLTFTNSEAIGGNVTGTGSLIKNGTGELRVTGNMTQTGSFTINDGPNAAFITLPDSALLIGNTLRPSNILSDTSTLTVGTPANLMNIDFVQNDTNLGAFERIGALSGGNSNVTLNLLNRASITILATGGNNASTTWSGVIAGDNAAASVIKEGTGKMTVATPQTNDGFWMVDNGTLSAGVDSAFDAPSIIWASNRSTAGFELAAGVSDTVAGIIGGGAGSARSFSVNGAPTGFLSGNYIAGTGGGTVLGAGSTLTLANDTAANTYVYGGVISGTGGLTKNGRSTLELRGANTYTGQTTLNNALADNTTNTLRLGYYGAASGLGAPSSGGQGSLSPLTSMSILTAITNRNVTFDMTGANQTLNSLTASASGQALVLIGNGNLTINTTSGFSGSFGGIISGSGGVTVNATNGFGGWILENANRFTGPLTINGGTVTFNSLVPNGAIADATRVIVGAAGSILVFSDETVGSIGGAGSIDISSSVNFIVNEGWGGAGGALASMGQSAFTGTLTGDGNFQLRGGGLRLSANTNTLLGSFTVGAGVFGGLGLVAGTGTLVADYTAGATDIIPGDWNIGGAKLWLKGNSVADSANITNLYSGATMIAPFQTTDTSRIGLGDITRNVGSALLVVGNSATTTTTNVNSILGGYATFGNGTTPYSGTTWAVANGAGTAISGLAAYTTSTGAANFGAAVNYNATINDTETGNVNSIRFNTTAPITLTLSGAGQSIITSGGILVTPFVGTNLSQITTSGTRSITADSGQDVIIHQYNTLNSLLINVEISDNSFSGLTKAGPGTVILAKNNTFEGPVVIGAGRLQVGNGGTTGTLGGSNSNIVNNGVLAVNRSDAFSLDVDIKGTGWLRQDGAGALTLGGISSEYSGRTSIAANRTLIVVKSGLGTGGAQTGGLGSAAELTSIESGATLNLGGGNSDPLFLSEIIALKGGTLLESTTAGTQSISSGTITLQGLTNTISTAASGDEFRVQSLVLGSPDTSATVGLQPANLVIGGLGVTTFENAANTYGGTTTINSGATLQLGATFQPTPTTFSTTAGSMGRGAVTNNGKLVFNVNDAHYVFANTISGSGGIEHNRNAVYLTANNTYSGATLVTPRAGENVNADLRVGLDTFFSTLGTGPITLQAGTVNGTSGDALLRYHVNNDYTVANAITLNPSFDAQTTPDPKNTSLIRYGLGSMTLTGTITVGDTSAGPGTQRAIVQSDGGGRLNFNATLVGGANNLLNIVNNGIVVFGGTASNTFDGVLSGNNVWVFKNSGTTTLNGVNTFNTGNTYIDKGTVVLNNSAGTTINDDNDTHVLSGATLRVNTTETIGQLYTQRNATVNITAGNTLTVDDSGAQLLAGSFTGPGDLTLAGGNYMAMYGTNTLTGAVLLNNGTIQTPSLVNALGTAASVTLGSGTNGGALEYIGGGETFAKNITLGGTGSGRITANGTGALTISGGITATANSTLLLTGQTGGYFNPITNKITGAITEGTNTLAVSMPSNANDDRFGVTGRWALTNKANDFSGNITVNVGMLEIGGVLNDGGAGLGGLGSGTGATSSMGDLTVPRTINLGTNNFDGRRYDAFGGGDQIGAVGIGTAPNTPTNTLTPVGSYGTIIFNDPNIGTATLGSNVTFTQSWSSTTNPGAGQIINDGTKVIVINGLLTSGANGNRNWILDGANAGDNTINGVISNGSGNTVGILKEGAGTWVLNNTANTFTGDVTVANGTLKISGGGTIGNSAAVNITGAGSDGVFSGTARLHVVSSEIIGTLSGGINTSVVVDAGQILTISGGANTTYNGVISGAGGLSRSVTSTANGTLTLSARNSYSGVTTLGSTGTSSATAGVTVYSLANGGINSGIGASGSAASNLVFTTNTANDRGGILTWQGFGSQSTDRLFTMDLGAAGARINAAGVLIGTTVPAIAFTNTGAIAMNGSGVRTLTLGGSTITNNIFRPQITDSGGATSLAKVDAGIWVINPDVAGNTYTGGTSITSGTLAIQAGNALGTNTITINGGAGVGLELRNGLNLANSITNSTTDGGVRASSGANVLSGTVTASAQIRVMVDAGASIELNNAVTALTGSGALIKFGEGDLILSGTNNSTGATQVRGGALVLDFSTINTSKLADGASLTLGGAGGLTTVGVDNNVSGLTYALGTTGGTVQLKGGSHTEAVSATTLSQGASAVIQVGGTSVLRMNAITRNAGATVDFGAASIAQTDTNNVNGILGVGYATVGKTNWATSVASGAADTAITAFSAYGVNTYGATNNVDVTTFAGVGTAANTLRFNTSAGGTLDLNAATFAMTGGGLLVTPNVTSGPVIITNGTIRNAATTSGLEALVIHQHSSQALQINAVIANNTNAQALTKSGTGMVYLNALNTQTGSFNLNEGEVQVGGTAAAPTTATAARLGGANVPVNMSDDTILRFLSTETAVQDLAGVQGGGTIILAAGNAMPVLLDFNNTSFFGDIEVRGGTLQIATNNAALGDVRGITSVFAGATLQFNDSRSTGEYIYMSEGAALTTLAGAAGTLSGPQFLQNTTSAGVTYNIAAPATPGAVGLTISGIINGSNGFTKTGNGILQLNANNFTDVIDGFTGANKSPSLFGQIKVNQGILYVGNARALSATGVGNETVVASGATVDLRDADLNYGDDNDPSREIFKISGSGVNGTGALRNSTGTGQFSHLVLDANATVSGGGFLNGSRLDLSTYDTNINNGSGLAGNFTRSQPTIAGNNKDLIVLGSGTGGNLVLHEPNFTSPMNSLTVKEGVLRLEQDAPPNSTWTGVTAANITNGITIGYGGASLANQTDPSFGVGPNVGARLNLFRSWDIHHTVNIAMDGITAAANGGANYIDLGTDTIVAPRTYLDGTITLTGAANRNIFQTEAGGNYSVEEQGNLTVGLRSKLIIGGQIVGSGGFTKTGFSELRLTNDNTFTGALNVLRFGNSSSPWESNTVRINGVDYQTFGNAEGWAEWGVTLNGTGVGETGKLSGVSVINLQRRGMITLDNTTRLNATSSILTGGNDNDRINNSATLNLSDGWLRINGGSAANNTEALATVGGAKMNIQSGTTILDLYPTDGSNRNMTLTIGEMTRSAGGVLRIQDLDATSTFSTASPAGADSVRVALTSIGTLTQVGGGGAAGTTNRNVVVGVLGGIVPVGLDADLRALGFANAGVTDLYNQQRNLQFLAGSHFMTYDGGFLRPLDDSEYFTTTNGVITSTNGAGQNVSVSDATTIVSGNTAINSLRIGPVADSNGSGGTFQTGTTLTSFTDHHAINLYVDGTLSITSGMLSSAYFTVGNTSSLSTLIIGGNLDFGTREAIINNQNGMYRLTDGTIATGNLEIRSNILGSGGLTKTGLAQVVLDGQNAYSGLTSISDGVLFLRNGRTALGVGGAGNGVYISGNGNLNSGNGIQVGTALAREDIFVGPLNGDQQIMRVDNDLTNWFSNVTIDNVDAAGLVLGTPRIRTDNAATSIINGNIGGGSTAISNDVLQIDSRIVQFDSTGNNTFIIRGQIGDKIDGSGNAVPISDPISTLPTLAGVRTNENDVLRVTFAGGSDETNFILDKQYNAVGRLTLARGTTIINYDPAGGGLDGTGFWTNTALSRIPNADSTTTAYAVNGGTTQEGFVFGTTGNAYNALFLARPGQTFNMSSWSMVGTGAKFIGGLNESGTVTYGNGAGSLTVAGASAQLYAASGGTVVFNQRMAGSLGIVKVGRGTVELQNTGLATASDAAVTLQLAGGTLIVNNNGQNVARVGNQNVIFSGGTLRVQANTTSGTTTGLATDNAASRVVNFNSGGSEIIAEARGGENMTLNLGNANTNSSTANLVRSAGATANFVEWSNGGGTPVINMDYNATSQATLPKNSLIPWATFSTTPRTAADFAMVDNAASNRVKGYVRTAAEEQNDVTLWSTIGGNPNVSENGSSGFRGTLVTETVNSVHFDAPADSRINIGGTLTLTNGGIMVSSAVGAANKTISGGNITAGGGAGGELIIHHYGTGALTIDSDISGPSSVTITGPSTTNPSEIGTTGIVNLVGPNSYTGKTTVNGAVLNITSETDLGATPTTNTADQLTLNGGTLRFTGVNGRFDQNRGVTIGSNGGVFDIVNPDANFFLETAIVSAGQYRGDLIKTGAGILTLEGDAGNQTNGSASFQGLIDVREGTLRLAGEDSSVTGSVVKTILGSTLSAADGTILRNGANLMIQMGYGSNSTTNTTEWQIEEWLTMEGNNRVTVGIFGLQYLRTSDNSQQSANKTVNLNGPIFINGPTTFDTVGGATGNQILRLNNGSGFISGSGDIIKEGQGRIEFRANIPDWTGNLIINQGDVYALNQADVIGTGWKTGKSVTLGSSEQTGVARLLLQNPDTIQNWAIEINHDISVTYNPAQVKTLAMETAGNGNKISFNGNITLNDNLNIYMNDAAEVGGSQNYVNFNGQLKDGAVTSGNITFFGDDAGGANDNTSGRTVNYAVLNANNSLWTGDVTIGNNLTYDHDQTTVVRLGHAQALTAANDVTMTFNSILQVGGQTSAIGSLYTNGGNGQFFGAANTLSASTNGSTEIIENAASVAGALTINQTTPANIEVSWDAKFRDGTLNSVFFAPGTNTAQPSAALSLVKGGSGWATLTLDNDYTGTTTITGGVLQVGRGGVGDTGAPTAAGLIVNSGATLAGTGTVQGTTLVQTGAALKPGDVAGSAIGTLTVAGNMTLQTGTITTLQVQRPTYNNTGVVGNTSGGVYSGWVNGIPTDYYSSALSDPVLTTQHDAISVLGNLTWTTGAKIVIANNGYTPNAGDIFDLFDWFGVINTVNVGATLRTGAETGTDLDLFELGGDYRWDTSLFNSQGILVVSLPGIVPEPGRFLLLMFGLAGLLIRRRRRSC